MPNEPKKVIRAVLTLTVDYDPATTDKATVRSLLSSLVEHTVSVGLLSGDGPTEIETWRYNIIVETPE